MGGTIDEKRALLVAFTKPTNYRDMVAWMRMIGGRSGRVGVGMDLADKFKADLPTAGKIWKLKAGPL